jgi:hypothetical protein
MTEDISDADINSALANIGRTSDGRLLYRYLQRELMGIARTSENGALQVHHGTRTLAANLMARMSSGIAEKSSDYASGGRFDLVVFTAPKPVDTGARRQSARDFLSSEPST